VLVNPLFNQDEDDESQEPHAKKERDYALQHRKGRTIQPISKDLRASSYTPVIPQVRSSDPIDRQEKNNAAAVDFIRQKVAQLYTESPDIKEELQEAATPQPHPSRHQLFMQGLSTSGKPLAQIQTEWHDYYLQLPDDEKHAVWREFYQANTRQPSAYTAYVTQQPDGPHEAPPDKTTADRYPSIQPGATKAVVGDYLPTLNYAARKKHRENRSTPNAARLKKQLLDKVAVSAETQSKAKQQLQSLFFGLGTGVIVLIIFLFGFFNEVFIAPFIQPSRHVSATPIIVNSDSVAASDASEVIIPKINVQIPTVFDNKSVNESDVQSALERGVTHYPTTALPGQQGNTAFFGHSSNNIFNKGKYKFAFVLLHELVPGDIFYLTYNKQVFTYKVFDKKIVPPSEVSVLNNVPGKTATATLITCDPPGTSTNRLVVWGEQVSPDPTGAAAATPTTSATTDQSSPVTLPSEGPTLWGRFWNWLFN
jgi:LPXTG-site transpeptidase (sortase) family protein